MIDVRLVTAAALDVPDPDLPRLADALRAAGCSVEVADWRDPDVAWESARCTVVRSPWDYVDALTEFLGWADHVASVSSLWNPIDVVRWNTHKSYLLELATWGAPVVPTVVLLQGSAASLDGICDARGWNSVVVKPAVGVGARGAGRFDVGDPAGAGVLEGLLVAGDVLVQPFVSSVATEGEWSVVLVEGRMTHALRKRAAPGDFRIQEHWGGSTQLVEPSASLVELAERVGAVLPWPTLYARVDVVRYQGSWHLLELEATEPSLWLDLAPPSATDRLVGAVMSRCR
jgi:hypothetical protein